MTSWAKAQGRFSEQAFRYLADEDVYVCPADQRLTFRYTNEQGGLARRHYCTNACPSCQTRELCTTGREFVVHRQHGTIGRRLTASGPELS